MTTFSPDDTAEYDPPVETYELALESVLRWVARSDMNPGDRLRAVQLVAQSALAK